MKLPRPRSGFTLIELLIVVAIIGILAALVSSAIMKLTKTAANKRNVNNAERLEAAIVEYWHDMGRWPIPKKGLTITPGKGTGLAGSSDEGKDVDTYSYTTAFKANNNEIVEKLINATLPDGTQKTFLDLHGFSTPIDASGDGPYEDVVDAYLAYTGDARKPDGSTFTQKKPTLVYFAPFPECPKRHRIPHLLRQHEGRRPQREPVPLHQGGEGPPRLQGHALRHRIRPVQQRRQGPRPVAPFPASRKQHPCDPFRPSPPSVPAPPAGDARASRSWSSSP